MAGELQKSGNLTGLYMAEEQKIGVLPGAPVWFEREPNSYGDFGGDYATTTRKPITHDRQHGKSDVSDNNPTVSYQEDFTPTNMIRPLQGFMFADAHEKATTAPLNVAPIVITAITGTDTFTAASGLTVFKTGDLIIAKGFAEAANNGLHVVTSSVAGGVVVGSTLVNEGSAPAGASLTVVGKQFTTGDLEIAATTDKVTLTSSAVTMTDLGLVVGEWIGVGGDTMATRFSDSGDNAPFYGQIDAITANSVVLRKTTGKQVTNNGTGKTIQLWFGTVIKNEADCSKIKTRSWTFERRYGCGNDAEAEYVGGACANQITLTIPEPGSDAKVTLDLDYIGCTAYERLGQTPGEALETGDRVSAFNEPAYKPGLDVYVHKLNVIDEQTLNPTSLVGYNSEATLVINNNLAGNKAIETFGNAGINIGEFEVTGSLGAYFPGVEVMRKIRQGAELTWHVVLTRANTAVIADIASLGLGNARASVEANTPVKLPLDMAAGRGKHNYTLLFTFLTYAPKVLMTAELQ